MKRHSITFDKFKYYYLNNLLPNKDKHLRDGQVLMNYLHEIWIEEYKRIIYHNIIADCFNSDILINTTLIHLESVWKNRDIDIVNDKDVLNEDKRLKNIHLDYTIDMTLLEFAGYITKGVKKDDLPQLIAYIVQIVNDEKLSIPLINHFEYLKNVHYCKSDEINKPNNLLNY